MRWIRLSGTISFPCPILNPLADGLRASLEGLTLPILRRHMARFFALREKEIVQALQFAHERLRLMIKPSSVVACSSAQQKLQLVSKQVGVGLT